MFYTLRFESNENGVSSSRAEYPSREEMTVFD